MNDRYLLAYQAFDNQIDEDRLISLIDNARQVKSWSHPFVGLFFLTSDDDLEQLSKPFNEFFIRGPYVVVKLTGSVFNAALAKPTWDWLKEQGSVLVPDKSSQ